MSVAGIQARPEMSDCPNERMSLLQQGDLNTILCKTKLKKNMNVFNEKMNHVLLKVYGVVLPRSCIFSYSQWITK